MVGKRSIYIWASDALVRLVTGIQVWNQVGDLSWNPGAKVMSSKRHHSFIHSFIQQALTVEHLRCASL